MLHQKINKEGSTKVTPDDLGSDDRRPDRNAM